MRIYRETYRNRRGDRCETKAFYVDVADHQGIRRRWPLGTANRRAAEGMAQHIEDLIACRLARHTPDRSLAAWLETIPPRLRDKLLQADLIDPERAASSVGLQDQLDGFQRYLQAKGVTQKHFEQQVHRIQRIITACRFTYGKDIDASRVMEYIGNLTKGSQRQDARGRPLWGRSASTTTKNYYLKAIKHFCRWMRKHRRMSYDPLEHVPLIKDDGRRIRRRALTLDEVRRLLQVTATQPEYAGVSGQERALIYRLALETGLRANELRTLTASSLDLVALVVRVRAHNTKNGREAELPLRPGTVALLKVHLAGKFPLARALRVPDKPAQMIYRDLEAAGIDFRDNGSGKVDFHSLRHTFGTFLAASGVHPKTAQDLMRHGDINLTMSRYTHTLRSQRADAVNQLPAFDASDQAQGQRSYGAPYRK